MVTATFGQALAGPGYAVDTVGVLILWRFIVSPSKFFSGSRDVMNMLDGDWLWG